MVILGFFENKNLSFFLRMGSMLLSLTSISCGTQFRIDWPKEELTWLPQLSEDQIANRSSFECRISINDNKNLTTDPQVKLTLMSSDNRNIVGYFLSQQSNSVVGAKWVSLVAPTPQIQVPYSLSPGNGIKAIYGWCKDQQGRISAMGSDAIGLRSLSPVANYWHALPLRSSSGVRTSPILYL